jgi:hypothetical protein
MIIDFIHARAIIYRAVLGGADRARGGQGRAGRGTGIDRVGWDARRFDPGNLGIWGPGCLGIWGPGNILSSLLDPKEP